MIKAISDRVFIRLDPEKSATDAGIILMDDYHQSRNIGTVESVGSEVSSVKKGDKVLFHMFDELPSYDKEVVVVRENSIFRAERFHDLCRHAADDDIARYVFTHNRPRRDHGIVPDGNAGQKSSVRADPYIFSDLYGRGQHTAAVFGH